MARVKKDTNSTTQRASSVALSVKTAKKPKRRSTIPVSSKNGTTQTNLMSITQKRTIQRTTYKVLNIGPHQFTYHRRTRRDSTSTIIRNGLKRGSYLLQSVEQHVRDKAAHFARLVHRYPLLLGTLCFGLGFVFFA